MVLIAACSAVVWVAPVFSNFTDTRSNVISVDLELVLAVDISGSMDSDEQALQREGYRLALTSDEFLQALRKGVHGRIAITYVEWAGQFDQKVIVPWRLIDGPEAAEAVAAEIGRASYRRASRTSISAALHFASRLFGNGGYHGLRQVIDVSGDGVNNSGPPVVPMRDEVVKGGITINGLSIMLKRPDSGMMDNVHLDYYYHDCVIGGPGAFVVPVRDRAHFIEATRTKLVLEVAGRTPGLQSVRVMQASAERPRVACVVGETFTPIMLLIEHLDQLLEDWSAINEPIPPGPRRQYPTISSLG